MLQPSTESDSMVTLFVVIRLGLAKRSRRREKNIPETDGTSAIRCVPAGYTSGLVLLGIRFRDSYPDENATYELCV